jgi:hypothetical protein
MATRPISHTDPATLWSAIARAGGIDAYVGEQLRSNGFLVERRDTENMSKRQLAQYKKSLKAEAAEKRRLGKAAWLAYRAAHIVHLGEGVYYNDAADFDRYDLAEPENRAAENELPPLDSPTALAEALSLTIPELRWLAYHREAATGLHYRRFTVPKRSGGVRAIWAPLPRLKEAQRWILREIVEHLPVHGAAHGFMPGRSILSNAQAHTGSKVLVNLDLKDFFPSVTVRRVKGVFRKAGYREQVATLLAQITTEAPREVVQHDGKTWYIAMGPRCLPQGAPTSPAITNTLARRLDVRLSAYAKKHGWRYTRYADDLTFSVPLKHKGPVRVGTLIGTVRAIAASEGFEVNEKKTRVCRLRARQKVTGLIVNGDTAPRVPRQVRRMLRSAVYNLEQGKPLPEGETLARLAGYAAFIYQCNAEEGADYLARIAKQAEARSAE